MILKIKKNNIYIVIFAVIYIIEQNFLYLLPENYSYSYIAYVIILIFLFFVLNQRKRFLLNGMFTLPMIFTVIMSLIAAFVEFLIFNDANVVVSFLNQGQWWINAFVYIIAVELLRSEKIHCDQLENMMIKLGVLQLIIGISQYLFKNVLVFTYAPVSTRLGVDRYRFPMVLMDFLCLWGISNIFKGKNRIISVILVIAVLFEAMFVEQFRSTAIGLVAAIIFGFLVWKKVSYKKIVIALISMIAIYVFYLNSPFLQESIAYLLSDDSSLSTRGYLITFQLKNFLTSPLLGYGWVSSNEAYYYAATPYRVNLSWNTFSFADGGIFSIMYCYGILGLLWVVVLWWKMLKTGYKLIKYLNEYVFFLLPLFFLITIYIDVHWRIHNQFYVLAIFCAIMEYKYKSIRNSSLK